MDLKKQYTEHIVAVSLQKLLRERAIVVRYQCCFSFLMIVYCFFNLLLALMHVSY